MSISGAQLVVGTKLVVVVVVSLSDFVIVELLYSSFLVGEDIDVECCAFSIELRLKSDFRVLDDNTLASDFLRSGCGIEGSLAESVLNEDTDCNSSSNSQHEHDNHYHNHLSLIILRSVSIRCGRGS